MDERKPRRLSITCALAAGALLAWSPMTEARVQNLGDWPVHSTERPQPPVVDPGPAGPPLPAPSDAIVLFDGSDLKSWRAGDGGPAGWRLRDGWVEVVAGAGSLVTAEGFGDVQLHVEWASPATPTGEGQGRGNSGIFLMGRYEVQVLDSYENPTYPDGQAAALFGQYPPLVNASRPPGEWQTLNIVFRAPRFGDDGELLRGARVTVLHNGVLVQDNVQLTGATAFNARPPYEAHPPRLPISIQDHGDPVRFRNIWVRELDDGRGNP